MKIIFQITFIAILLSSIYFSLTPSASFAPMLVNDKLVHMVGYFVLMLTFDFSLKSGNVLFIKAVAVFMYSCAIEYAQGFIPGREVSLLDIVANGIGITGFLLCVPIMKKFEIYRALRIL